MSRGLTVSLLPKDLFMLSCRPKTGSWVCVDACVNRLKRPSGAGAVRITVFVARRVGGESVDVRRRIAVVAIPADVVGPQAIDGEQDDRRLQ